MTTNRRHFLKTAVAAATLPSLTAHAASSKRNVDETLHQAITKPVLDLSSLKQPIIIDAIELLRKQGTYFVRVRSKDGAEGISVDNGRAEATAPILTTLIMPYFLEKDARDIEEHLFGVYRHRDNYKFQGLAFWSPLALVEFAILDLLGRVARKSIGDLLGGAVRDRIPFYIASGRRDTTAQQEVEYLQRLIDENGAKSVKYRIGGRMNRNVDALPGRTEALIPLSRKVLGDKIAIHADSNSSYDAREAIRIGRMLEDIGAVFYEEPCPFDDFDATKRVTDALKIPIALGEQEYSEARFEYCVRHHVADIMQPDLFYYGGMIRSMRVARMAAARGMPATCHISGGFGFVYMLHYASVVRDPGAWQEYKAGLKQYGDWFSPALKIVDGALTVPKGHGVGISDPTEVLKDAEVVRKVA